MVRLTDRPDMTLDVYRGRKTTKQLQLQLFFFFEKKKKKKKQKKKKQDPKMPDFNTNQNIVFTIASSVEGSFTANQMFL